MHNFLASVAAIICFITVGMAVYSTLLFEPVAATVYAAVASVAFLIALISAGPSDA